MSHDEIVSGALITEHWRHKHRNRRRQLRIIGKDHFMQLINDLMQNKAMKLITDEGHALAIVLTPVNILAPLSSLRRQLRSARLLRRARVDRGSLMVEPHSD